MPSSRIPLLGRFLPGTIAMVSLILAAAFAVPSSSEPWKDKDYQSWTQDDVQRILFKSPWVKLASVNAPWLTGGTLIVAPGPAGCDPRSGLIHSSVGGPINLSGTRDSVDIFQVTWLSARTVRAAKLREAELCRPGRAEIYKHLLEEPQEHYVITVASPDMTPFNEMDEAALIKATSLQPKKSSRAYSPESVAIMGRAGGRTDSLTFKFARKTQTGDPIIANDEKEVEFTCQAGKVKVQARFQMQKMISREGPDF